MPRVGVGVHPLVLGLHFVHGLLDRLRDHDAAERKIARRHALGEGDDVGQHVPVLEREPLAGAAETGDDLVRDEEHVVLVADLPHQREVVVGGVEHPAPAVDRLGDEGGHRVRTLAHDGLFQEARGGLPRGLSRLGALLTVRITSWNMHEARHAGLEHLPVGRHAGRAHRLQRHAVIGERARDDLHLVGLALGLPVEPRGLERGLRWSSAWTRAGWPGCWSSRNRRSSRRARGSGWPPRPPARSGRGPR